MPVIPQQGRRQQSRSALLVKWNWAQKPLQNPLYGCNTPTPQMDNCPASPLVRHLPWEGSPRSTPSFSTGSLAPHGGGQDVVP